MNSREAKDFIVQEIMQQATLDGVSVSNLEKRMMYFTESGEAVEGPIALNAEFEAQYDSAVFEKKISMLMQRAYARLARENPQSTALWDEGIDALLAGDHYLLVMWDMSASSRITAAALVKLGAKILIPLLIVGAVFWTLNRYFGSAVHLGSIMFISFIAVAIAFSILRAVRPQAVDLIVGRIIYGTAKYLFGRKDANKVP